MLSLRYPRNPSSRLARLTQLSKSPTVLVMAATAKAKTTTTKAKTTPATIPKAKAKPPAYYAVPKGSKKGIYRDYWAEVIPALKGVKSAVQRKFDTEEEARGWLEAYEKGEPCEYRYTVVSPQFLREGGAM